MVPPALIRALEAQDQKQHEAALRHFNEAIAAQPTNWVAYTGQGNSLRALKHLDAAIASYTKAVEVAWREPRAWTQLGFGFHAQGRIEEALLCLGHAAKLDPVSADSQNNVAVVALAAEHYFEAEKAARRAVSADPGHVRGNINLGRALKEQGRLDEAEGAYRNAIALAPQDPDARWNLGLLLMMTGRWQEGWRHYELRTAIPGQPAVAPYAPLWAGQPLHGEKLLVQAEKGLGDTIQFARYLHLLKTRTGAGSVILECRPPLVSLLSRCAGVDTVVRSGGPLPHFDLRVPMMSLPLLLDTPDPAATAVASYLTADPALVDAWRTRLRHGVAPTAVRRKLGIAWQGNSEYLADHHRSIPLPKFIPLLRRARDLGFDIFSLQKGYGCEQLAALPPDVAVEDLSRALDEGQGGAFVDTAAVISDLDLVITSDTAIPHLAGALGAPVWMLLPHLPDWRWGVTGVTSPWYPQMRVFRQRQAGDWAGVFNEVITALAGVNGRHP
ncbi:MAG TPA: tetratricopeptide repeat-containing glycosyltransferase family protein [Polyangia bacterium]|nr:tetratricopeptide repeat-containing glycosyltransferase family protein [Polyangia bacterium]